MDSVKGMFTSFTRLDEEDGPSGNDEESLMTEFNQTCKLSAKTRMYGFVACFCLGFVLSILVHTARASRASRLFADDDVRRAPSSWRS